MTVVWSPETASKAYLDTIQTCGISSKTSAAEFLSAMAAGYNAKLIVEAWNKHENGHNVSNIAAISTGLAIATKHTHGRHVCIVPDETWKVEYVSAMQKLSSDVALPEFVVGPAEAEEITRKLNTPVDFFFVEIDGGRKDFITKALISSVKLNQHGAILVCKRNISTTMLSWNKGVILDAKVSVVRAITLPFGNIGLEIAYVASSNCNNGNLKAKNNPKRWIRHVDQESGEEHMIRR